MESARERARELLLDYAAGDLEARDRVITENLGLVNHVMKGFRIPEGQWEDAYQEGVAGLIRAVDKFDLKKGTALSTYATIWIRKAVFDYLEYRVPAIRYPETVCTLRRRIAAVEDSVENVSLEVLADQLGVSTERVAEVKGAPVVAFSIDGLRERIGDDPTERLLRDSPP